MSALDPHDFLYEGALQHVSKWEKGRLEARSAVFHSSQALCVSVFGALDGHPKSAEIIRAVCDYAGVQVPSDEPVIECEVRSHRDLLNEYGTNNPTSPDALIRWPNFVLTVESKFREQLGRCGQVKKTEDGQACSGNHEEGSDLRTKTDATCRLTIQEGKRTPRLYWEVGKSVFLPEILAVPRRPCPFADGSYQLMRNINFAAAFAAKEGLPSYGFIVAYVAAASSAKKHMGAQINRFREMLLPDVRDRFGAISYENIAVIARKHGDGALADWIERRLREGLTGSYAHE
jgi:hypothetical protein